jgi:hypothetical protein
MLALEVELHRRASVDAFLLADLFPLLGVVLAGRFKRQRFFRARQKGFERRISPDNLTLGQILGNHLGQG